MVGEKTRSSYILKGGFLNRMQVVVELYDGKIHVFNFHNYMDEAHSHQIYYYGSLIFDSTRGDRDNFEHSYSGYRAEYYNAEEVSSFPYEFKF